MSDIRLTQINSIILDVTDLARASAFYRETWNSRCRSNRTGSYSWTPVVSC